MARSWFGGTSADQVVRPFNFGASRLAALAAFAEVTFWDAVTGGTRHLDLLLAGASPVDAVPADEHGYLPRFQGPDGVQVMWADMGDGTPRRLMVTTAGAIAAAEGLASKIDVVEKGALNGVAELGPTGKIVQPVPVANLEGVVDQANLPAHLDEAGLSAATVDAINARVMHLDDQPGVALDGTTECGVAIQAAIDAAEAANLILVAGRRVYHSATTLVIKKSADFYESTLAYEGATGTAFRIGGTTRQAIKIGRVVNNSKVNPGWVEVAGSIAVDIQDTSKSEIHIKSLADFETGFRLYGNTGGVAYNTIFVGELRCKVNHATESTASGWTNSNVIVGGSWNHQPLEGTAVPGTRHVLHKTAPSSWANTNLYLGCSFEGNGAEYYVESYGRLNSFRDCRWEALTPKVWWRAGSYKNAIRDGYKPDQIVITDDANDNNTATWPGSGDTQELSFGATQMVAAAGAPAAAITLRHPAMSMVATDMVAFPVVFPANWRTYDVEIRFTHSTANTGTTSWLYRNQGTADGGIIVQPSGGTSISAVAVGAQHEMVVQTLATAEVVPAARATMVNLSRSAGGTFPDAVLVLSVTLRRRA